MVPIDAALGELSTLSAQLNQATEVLNSIIRDLERGLAATKVGVSVWLEADAPFITDFLLAETKNGKKRNGWQLGYGKIADAWRILVRPVHEYWETPTEDPTEGYWVIEDCGEAVALANAPRQVRVEAAPHFERLIIELSNKVKKFLVNVEDAKKFAAPPF
jgi:hypothetical protein